MNFVKTKFWKWDPCSVSPAPMTGKAMSAFCAGGRDPGTDVCQRLAGFSDSFRWKEFVQDA